MVLTVACVILTSSSALFVYFCGKSFTYVFPKGRHPKLIFLSHKGCKVLISLGFLIINPNVNVFRPIYDTVYQSAASLMQNPCDVCCKEFKWRMDYLLNNQSFSVVCVSTFSNGDVGFIPCAKRCVKVVDAWSIVIGLTAKWTVTVWVCVVEDMLTCIIWVLWHAWVICCCCNDCLCEVPRCWYSRTAPGYLFLLVAMLFPTHTKVTRNHNWCFCPQVLACRIGRSDCLPKSKPWVLRCPRHRGSLPCKLILPAYLTGNKEENKASQVFRPTFFIPVLNAYHEFNTNCMSSLRICWSFTFAHVVKQTATS